MPDQNSDVVAEVAEDEVPVVPVVHAIDTHSPAANLATRDNIVPDGPGTVADFI